MSRFELPDASPFGNVLDVSTHGKPGGAGSAVTVGMRLTAAREAMGLGVRELSRLTNVSPGAISKIETGKRTKVLYETMDILAKYLGVSVQWLVNGEGDGPGSIRSSRTTQDRYPNRSEFIRRHARDYDPETIRRLRELRRLDDMPLAAWHDVAKEIRRQLATEEQRREERAAAERLRRIIAAELAPAPPKPSPAASRRARSRQRGDV